MVIHGGEINEIRHSFFFEGDHQFDEPFLRNLPGGLAPKVRQDLHRRNQIGCGVGCGFAHTACFWLSTTPRLWAILSCSFIKASSTASGRGGQPET